MAEYNYRVEYAFENEALPEDHVLHHGRGSLEITTNESIDSQAAKDEVARVAWNKVNEENEVTRVVVMAIIPQKTGRAVIDASTLEND